MNLIGLSTGRRDLPGAEHVLHELVALLGRPAVRLACTHFVGGFVDLSLETAGPVPLPRGFSPSGAAVEAHRLGGGRAVLFDGAEELTGVLTVEALVGRSAIERVTVLAGADPGPGARVDTLGYLRPARVGGALTLATTPGLLTGGGHGLVPFELADQGTCCGGH
ncbi:hypothetical protein ACIBH1_39695 [Nonomuraea sp. NPDC050663]|uniref:hypothetical protein n=1 Tax=Nonomuraea sp. NPDC050663 TaxID=3364370 RepID=UPI0037928D5C